MPEVTREGGVVPGDEPLPCVALRLAEFIDLLLQVPNSERVLPTLPFGPVIVCIRKNHIVCRCGWIYPSVRWAGPSGCSMDADGSSGAVGPSAFSAAIGPP